MKTSRYFGLLLLASLFTGCVSTKIIPVNEQALKQLQGGKAVVTSREKPGFSAMTAGKAMFGAIGGAAMATAGSKIVEDYKIDDPAVYIAKKLSDEIAADQSMTIVSTADIAKDTDAKALARQYAGSDLLIDVQTIYWSFIYLPTDWNHYRVIYDAKLRLVDVKKQQLLADGFCSRIPDQSANAPTYEDLLADGASRLKQELVTAADFCIQEFRTKVFKK